MKRLETKSSDTSLLASLGFAGLSALFLFPAAAIADTAGWTYAGDGISDGNWTIKTSTLTVDGEKLIRLGWTYNKSCRTAGSGELDLTKPVTDASGAVWKIGAVGYQAFYGDASVVKVKLPRELVELDKEAFRFCTNMTTLVAECPVLTNVLYNTFANCTNLTKMTFKVPRLKAIPQYMFSKCPLTETSFTTDIDMTAVTSIGQNAFYQEVENSGPSGCLYLPKMANLSQQNVFTGCARMTALEIGDRKLNLTIGGSAAFSGCTSLKKVVFRGATYSLGWSKNYFDGCPLEEVYLWGSNTKLDWDGLNNMLNYMFVSVPAPVDGVKFCRVYTSTKSGNFPCSALNAEETANIPADLTGRVLGAYAPAKMGNGRCCWVVKWRSPLDGGFAVVVR